VVCPMFGFDAFQAGALDQGVVAGRVWGAGWRQEAQGRGLAVQIKKWAEGWGCGHLKSGASHCFSLAFRQFVNTPFRVGLRIRSRWVSGPSVQAAAGPTWQRLTEGDEPIPQDR